MHTFTLFLNQCLLTATLSLFNFNQNRYIFRLKNTANEKALNVCSDVPKLFYLTKTFQFVIAGSRRQTSEFSNPNISKRYILLFNHIIFVLNKRKSLFEMSGVKKSGNLAAPLVLIELNTNIKIERPKLILDV